MFYQRIHLQRFQYISWFSQTGIMYSFHPSITFGLKTEAIHNSHRLTKLDNRILAKCCAGLMSFNYGCIVLCLLAKLNLFKTQTVPYLGSVSIKMEWWHLIFLGQVMIYHIPTYSDAFNFEVTFRTVKWEGRPAGISSDATFGKEL